ncbi:ion transporter, partial [Candidatus Woesearchaeota archaeon]|nr:ion transporter [Candidatus Woesearchaeota archaeon]
HDMVEQYHLEIWIIIADYIVISVFVLDLVFKWMRTRHLPKFLRKYWLDILAVFPFFLLFRLFEMFAGVFGTAVSEGTKTAQNILHESLEVEKEGAKIAREAEKFIKEGSRVGQEAEKLSKLSRSSRFMRFLRPILRLPRFFKAAPNVLPFYEKPHGGHHQHEFRPKKKK